MDSGSFRSRTGFTGRQDIGGEGKKNQGLLLTVGKGFVPVREWNEF